MSLRRAFFVPRVSFANKALTKTLGARTWFVLQVESSIATKRFIQPPFVIGWMSAAAALIAAAERPAQIAAVVSRGGRPDLAGAVLPRVQAPTLLLVGGNDKVVLQWNRDALQLLRAEKQLEIISGATHLFEEEGALERVAELAAQWFVKYLDVPRA